MERGDEERQRGIRRELSEGRGGGRGLYMGKLDPERVIAGGIALV